jgi:chitin disaccharide deacetylase
VSAAAAGERRIVLTADDFGLSLAVNEGIEQAHRNGVLTHASLMVAGAAAPDAVRRARRMPRLRVGLHLVTVAGPAVLPVAEIPDLVDERGWFPSSQFALGLRYAVLPQVRRQLAAEILAQFATFAATGLTLDHADAHKHMQLHPFVGRLLLQAGAGHDLRRVRVPAEPPGVMRACGVRPTLGSRAMHAWSGRFRRAARAAGMEVTRSVFGLAWSGHMTEERVLRLLAQMPDASTELYFHPASRRDSLLESLMPGYEHTAELAALVSPRVRNALAAWAARNHEPAAAPASAGAPARTPASPPA